MTVSSYLFQSPYTQPFQIGRPDPAMLEAKAKESEEQQNRIESNAQTFGKESSIYRESALAAKSAAAYANSEGFAMSTEQVRQLSETSFKSNVSSYIRLYAENSGY